MTKELITFEVYDVGYNKFKDYTNTSIGLVRSNVKKLKQNKTQQYPMNDFSALKLMHNLTQKISQPKGCSDIMITRYCNAF